MAEYGYGAGAPPSGIPYPHSAGSKEYIIDPKLISRAASGTVRGRSLQPAIKRGFLVEHEYLTLAEKEAVITFLTTTKRNTTFTFAWTYDSVNTYTVMLAEKDGMEWIPVGDHWMCRLNFLQQ